METTGRPVCSWFCRLDAGKLAAAKAELEQMEKEGIVNGQTAAGLCHGIWSRNLMGPGNAVGTTGTYRNLVTRPDYYPLPNMLDFAGRLAGCVVFSKLDLRKGYHQIPIAPEDICKTAIITPFGPF